mgnify:CR=1 FL=1
MFVYNIISLRDKRLHTSAIMLMCTIARLQDRTKSAYLGEIHQYYLEERNSRIKYKYTDKGIYSMLHSLRERGYVKAERHGRYLSYSLTRSGTVAVRLLVRTAESV